MLNDDDDEHFLLFYFCLLLLEPSPKELIPSTYTASISRPHVPFTIYSYVSVGPVLVYIPLTRTGRCLVIGSLPTTLPLVSPPPLFLPIEQPIASGPPSCVFIIRWNRRVDLKFVIKQDIPFIFYDTSLSTFLPFPPTGFRPISSSSC